jgi:hypothetical protein
MTTTSFLLSFLLGLVAPAPTPSAARPVLLRADDPDQAARPPGWSEAHHLSLRVSTDKARISPEDEEEDYHPGCQAASTFVDPPAVRARVETDRVCLPHHISTLSRSPRSPPAP